MGAVLANGTSGLTGAALEFVTDQPHGLRGGRFLQVPRYVTGFPVVLPITGGTQTALTGTVTVTNGSQNITFSQSQTFATGSTGIIFGADTTGAAYFIQGSGSGTNWTIYPAYNGTNSTTSTATTTPMADINSATLYCWPTGASTFAAYAVNTTGVTPGTTAQTLTSTAQIAANNGGSTKFQFYYAFGSVVPYGFVAKAASTWPGCIPWVPGLPYMTDACIEAIIDEMQQFLADGATIGWEMGLEHWNAFPTRNWCTTWGQLLKYVAPGTAVNSYYTTPTGGSVQLGNDQAYTAMSAHQHQVAQARLDYHGRGMRIWRIFGGQVTNTAIANNMINFATTLGSPSAGGLQTAIPIGSVIISFYTQSPQGNATLNSQCALEICTASVTNGSPSVTTSISLTGQIGNVWRFGATASSPGGPYLVTGGSGTSWTISPNYGGGNNGAQPVRVYGFPAAQLHDLVKHYYRYSSVYWTDLSGQTTVLAGYPGLGGPSGYYGQTNGVPGLVGYETGIDTVDTTVDPLGNHDAFYHPAMADTYNAFLQFMQEGSPLVTGGHFSGTRWRSWAATGAARPSRKCGRTSSRTASSTATGPPTCSARHRAERPAATATTSPMTA